MALRRPRFLFRPSEHGDDDQMDLGCVYLNRTPKGCRQQGFTVHPIDADEPIGAF